MIQKQKKVLIIDDDTEQHAVWELDLQSKVVVISAFSLDEARRCFIAHPDLDAIVIDACVPGNSPTTLPLVRDFRERGFGGPIIAVSTVREYRTRLIEAGCDYESPKYQLVTTLLSVLQ